MNKQPKVIIRCFVYNHEPYLRDCLEGFVMQKTDFPFKAVVHDDASTDNSAAIIREYAEKYPHIIEPIYETENQYSKRDGSLRRIMDDATLNRSPYIAYCEGDDYWIDPMKLQKQVDYMDKHPECTMTCSNVEFLTPSGVISDEEKKTKNCFFISSSRIVNTEEIIHHAGHTCTLLIRSSIMNSYPQTCLQCHVGDYPLQIYAALKGAVYCFSEKTAVYRYLSVGSWSSRQSQTIAKTKADQEISIINMLEEMNKFSNKKFEHSFEKQIYSYGAQAIVFNPALAYELCTRHGYIFLKYPQKNAFYDNARSLFSNILCFLLRIKWFPFKIGKFVEALKRIGWKKRIKITLICCISYFKHQ